MSSEEDIFNDIQDALEDISYKTVSDLKTAVDEGVKNAEFSDLISYLTQEISSLSHLEDQIQDQDVGSEAWMMELSSLLRELGCPWSVLTEGPVHKRLESRRSRLILLDFLLTELMSSRMMAVNKPSHGLNITMTESPSAASLRTMLQSLGFPKPPDNITALQLWDKVSSKVEEVQSRASADLLGEPLMSKQVLTGDQWNKVETVAAGLNADYTLRRRIMLTRLDATIQSFTWSDRMQGREAELGDMYRERRRLMREDPGLGVSDVLAARDDVAVVEKVSSSGARMNTRTSVNKVMIGAVPDRGGRTDTMQAPPPEMPSWSQRQPDQGRGGRGGGGRGGGGRGYQGGGGGGRGGIHHQGGGSHNKGGRGSGRVQGAGWSGGGHQGGGGGGYSNRGDRRQRY